MCMGHSQSDRPENPRSFQPDSDRSQPNYPHGTDIVEVLYRGGGSGPQFSLGPIDEPVPYHYPELVSFFCHGLGM